MITSDPKLRVAVRAQARGIAEALALAPAASAQQFGASLPRIALSGVQQRPTIGNPGRILCVGGRTLSMRGNRTTFNIGRISGGSAIKFVPECCEVLWEYRPPDEASVAAVEAEVERLLAAMSPGVDVEMAQIAEVPALAARNDSAAVAIARALGALWPPGEIPFGTEAGFFEQAGIPSLVCGPGAIAQAHQPNEWIAASELHAADLMLARLGSWATGAEARE